MKKDDLAQQMYNLVRDDPKHLEAIKDNPQEAIKNLVDQAAKQTLPHRPFVYTVAVCVLGALALIAAIAGLIIVITSKSAAVIPDSLVALGSAAVGALVGLFAPSPTDNG